ncbi:MAG: GGDEF domain-containing protein [Acholeplasmatales bacterium]|nr:GGDEF domain-containing protein [Acholeplasmatales bacterium]
MKHMDKDYLDNNEIATDSLTKTLSRKSLFNYIKYLIDNKEKFALFFIDFDDFKSINDTLGHNVGDEALIISSKRMKEIFDKHKGVVGRYGGDEFFAVVENVEAYDDVWNIAKELNEEIRKENDIENIEYALPAGKFTITTGIARYPLDADNIDDLFDIADRALYRGKQKGKNCFIVYNKDLHQNIFKNRDAKRLDTKNIIDYVFCEMTDETRSIDERLKSVFKFVGFYFNVSLVSKNSNGKLEIIYSNDQIEDAKYVDVNEYISLKANKTDSMMFMYINKLGPKYQHLAKIFEEQKIHASILVACETKKQIYEYLRIDAKYERIWTKEEKIIFQIIANLYAFILEYSNK